MNTVKEIIQLREKVNKLYCLATGTASPFIESDPTVPDHVKTISQKDIANWNLTEDKEVIVTQDTTYASVNDTQKIFNKNISDAIGDLDEFLNNKANINASNIDEHIAVWRKKVDANFVHDQATPSSLWTINHPLNKKVNVTITDTAGTVVEGQVTINNGNKVVIEFNFPFSGEAILN